MLFLYAQKCSRVIFQPQSLVSLRRIEKYLQGAEVTSVPPISDQSQKIAMQSATITWPQDRSHIGSRASSVASTPRHKFVLADLTIRFPEGKLSLICGRLGSGKTLLLLCMFSITILVSKLVFIGKVFSITRRSGFASGPNSVPPLAS